jgi:hypothetical protein
MFDIPQNKGGNFKLPPAGTHVAILLSVIDLGTQEITFQGEKKEARKVRFTWELPFEKDTFGDDPTERPYTASKEYTLSMHEKSTMRKDLEAWRGKPFTDQEILQFDEKKILGRPCTVTIIHTEKGEKKFANITAVANIPKGTQVPEVHGATFSYNTKDGNNTIYHSLPEWLQQKIAKSPEFQTFAKADDEPPEGHIPTEPEEDADPDNIPF